MSCLHGRDGELDDVCVSEPGGVLPDLEGALLTAAARLTAL